MAVIFAVPTVQPSPLLTNLQAYYKLDENTGVNVYDATSNHFDGTYSGTDSVSWVAGKINYAMAFNQTTGDGKVALPSGLNDALFPSTSASFSVAAWVYCNAGAAGWNTIAGSATAGGLQFRIDGSTGKLGLVSQGFSNIGDSTGSAAVNAWAHVGVTFNMTTHDWVFYANGSSIGSGNTNYPIYNWLIYLAQGYAGEQFKGYIDEIGFWSRILTADEFSTLYNSGSGKAYPFS